MPVDESEALAAAVDALRPRWPGGLASGGVERLVSSERTVVWRVRLRGSAQAPATVVVKAYTGPDPLSGGSFGWMRESAGLATLARAEADGPWLLAAVADPQLVVMTDVGRGPHLADALLGADGAVAGERLLRWADAVADLHAATAGSGDVFAAELAARAGDSGVLSSDANPDGMPRLLARAADSLAEHLPRLGVTPDPSVLDQVRALGELLPPAPGVAALTPSDACPDNNVEVDGRLVLLDYEGAEFRHVAWDAAYLRVPWPSCWCSWRMPDRVAEAGLARYRQRVAATLPYAATEQFDRDLDVATVGWAFVSGGWFLPRAFADPPPDNPRIVAPGRQPILQHRFAVAARAGAAQPAVPPAVTALAADICAAMLRAWGPRPLELAPVWRP